MKTLAQISYNMARVRASGSEIERTLGSALWAAGIRYRKQYRRAPGRPDFAIVIHRIAIFCDSSFWHGRDWELAAGAIRSNRDFWIPKIERNIQRDLTVNLQLKALGWEVLRFWDDEILNSTDRCVAKVLRHVARKSRLGRQNENGRG